MDTNDREPPSDEQAVAEMMHAIQSSDPRRTSMWAWLVFSLSACTCLVTLWFGFMVAFGLGTMASSPERTMFATWGPVLVVGSITTVPLALALAVASHFKPLSRRLVASAFGLSAFWPAAMLVLVSRLCG